MKTTIGAFLLSTALQLTVTTCNPLPEGILAERDGDGMVAR